MHASRFDMVTKAWATASRRRVLRGSMMAGLTALGLLHGGEEAEATHFDCRHVGARCKRNGKCCSGICQPSVAGQPKTCQAHDTGICTATQDDCVGSPGNPANECGTTNNGGKCLCLITTGGASYCSSGGACVRCKKDKDCYPGFPGAACASCPACRSEGNPNGTLCVLPCPNPTA